MESLKTKVYGSTDILKHAKGVLIMPKVYRGGIIGVGAEYGEGALRINGKTVDYYNIFSGSIGFQLGGQVKTIFLFEIVTKIIFNQIILRRDRKRPRKNRFARLPKRNLTKRYNSQRNQTNSANRRDDGFLQIETLKNFGKQPDKRD